MFLRIAIMAAGMVLAMPVHAQSGVNSAETAVQTPQPDGYRIARGGDGFQLVEHGIWPAPSTPSVSAVSVSGDERADLADRSRQGIRGGPSGFRRAAYLPHVYAAETQFALPAGLLDALIWTESRYNPLAVSKAGAAGLGQLMPGTAKELGVVNRFDPQANLSGAARYLRQMLDRFGSIHLALAAYNAGPGAVERARGIPLNGETPAYVRNVLRHWRF